MKPKKTVEAAAGKAVPAFAAPVSPAGSPAPRKTLLFFFALAGGALSFAAFLVILKAGGGPRGLDAYYYALQTKSLAVCGELLFSDDSFVYYFLWLFNLAADNPVLANQMCGAFSMAVIFGCLLLVSFRGGPTLYKTGIAFCAVFNPATLYQLLEFTKNNFALAAFFAGFVLLTDSENGYPPPFSLSRFSARKVVRVTAGCFFCCISVMSHRMMLVLLLLFAAHAAAVFFAPRFLRKNKNTEIWPRRGVSAGAFIAGGGILLCAASLAALFIFGTGLSGRLSSFAFAEPLRRLRLFTTNRLLTGERVFYIFIQTVFFFFIPFRVIRSRRFDSPGFVFACIGWLFVFPFLRFSWDGIGFRLLLLSPLMTAPWLMEGLHGNHAHSQPVGAPGIGAESPQPAFAGTQGGLSEDRLSIAHNGRGLGADSPAVCFFNAQSAGKKHEGRPNPQTKPRFTANAAGVIFIAAALLFAMESARYLSVSKGPDYRRYAQDFAGIGELAAGRRVIAHRGLAGFLWFEKGVWSENFIPAEEPELYLRLVYAFSPEIFAPYLNAGDPRPLAVGGYTLVEEYIWQRFSRARSGIRFLQSELNPNLPRPKSAFVINRRAARALSPVTFAP